MRIKNPEKSFILLTARKQSILILMFDEDGRKINIRNFPADLKEMSVDDLQGYIQELREEIYKVEAEIQSKNASKAAADNFFK